MTRLSVRHAALLTSIVGLSTAVPVSSQKSARTRRAAGPDPAVVAFTSFVVGKDLAEPADRAIVVAAMDRLACDRRATIDAQRPHRD